MFFLLLLFVLFSQERRLQLKQPEPLAFIFLYSLSRGKAYFGGFGGGDFMSSLCVMSKLRCRFDWAGGCSGGWQSILDVFLSEAVSQRCSPW